MSVAARPAPVAGAASHQPVAHERTAPLDASPGAAAPHVVVVGGGFAGLYAAKRLARYPLQVTVVDQRNYHLFQPLLYEVATAAQAPSDIAEPIRSILRPHRNVRVVLAGATAVDLERRRLVLDRPPGEIAYDFLILATGARHSYFGRPDWEPLAPGLKTIEDALEIRRRILCAFEAAELEPDPAAQTRLLTFVVVGGGPTGVELAGAIADIARRTLRRDFRRIDPARARVILIEALPRVLPGFPKSLAAAAQRQLETLGVWVRTGHRVTEITPDAVHVGEDVLPTRTALWAAGVAASPLAATLGVALDRSGRVAVEPDLSLPGRPEVYVVGDLAAFTHQPGSGGAPLPGVAQVAMQQGRAAAGNVWRSARGRPRRAFRYVDRGSMATIGRAAAVARIGPLRLSGFAAWVAWLAVHLFWLIGFENRLLVLLRWAWSYFTYRRGARLITASGWVPPPPAP